MSSYFTFHQTALKENALLIKKLFKLDSSSPLGVQEVLTHQERNPKNHQQIAVPSIVKVDNKLYNVFYDKNEAFETLKETILLEFKIEESFINDFTVKNVDRELYFYIFDHSDEDEDEIKLRGILFATTKTGKPSFWVALNSALELEYDKEIYNI